MVSVTSTAANSEVIGLAQHMKSATKAPNGTFAAGYTSSKMGFTTKFTPTGAVRYAHTDTAGPNFESYRHSGSDSRQNYANSRSFTYVMSGGAAVVGAAASKNIVTGLVQSMSACRC